MPIYEFRCQECRKLTSVFRRTVTGDVETACEHCGSANTRRVISAASYHRSTADVVAGLPPPGEERLEDYKDPRVIGRWVEKKFDEYGMELPQSAREMIDAAREGVMPEPIGD
jgi:putative FmdB family regulatory protein